MLPPRPHKPAPRPAPQGEEYEILKAQRPQRRANEAYTRDLLEKAGHAAYPFLRDPFV